MKLTKHVGVYGKKPCIVIFRELPNDTENCLIVLTDNLPGQEHNDIINVVDSPEGQESNEISEVLYRRTMTVGGNMLEYLHNHKFLTKVPVNLVKLRPYPNQEIALEDLNRELRNMKNGTHQTQNDVRVPPEEQAPVAQTQALPEGESAETVDVAKGILFQAQLMEEDAARMLEEAKVKREEAYKMDPSLKPKRTTKKSTSTTSKKSTAS